MWRALYLNKISIAFFKWIKARINRINAHHNSIELMNSSVHVIRAIIELLLSSIELMISLIKTINESKTSVKENNHIIRDIINSTYPQLNSCSLSLFKWIKARIYPLYKSVVNN